MFQVAWAACCQKTVCPPWQKGDGNEEPRHLGSAWEPLEVAQVQRRDHRGFSSGSANGRVPNGKGNWEGRECTIALACPNLPLMPQFLPSPIEVLKERASNIPVIALLPPGTCALSCWRAKISQGDSQTYFRPFLLLNACARQLYREKQGPSKAAHTNVLSFEKVCSFNGDSFNWAPPSLGAIKWHLLALDWKATLHTAPSYPAGCFIVHYCLSLGFNQFDPCLIHK